MTALASVCTKEGFAIGADSLRIDMYGHIITEEAVKIHETGHPDFVGAFGFAGMTAFEFADERPMLDGLEFAKKVAAGLRTQHFDSAEQYAERFCNSLAAAIQAGCTGVAIPYSFRLRGMFLGHSRGQGACLQIGFPAINGYLLRPIVEESFDNPIDRFAEKEGLAEEYADVLAIIREQYDVEQWGQPFPQRPPSTSPSMTPATTPAMTPITGTGDVSAGEALPIRRPILRPGTRPGMRRPIMPDRPVYGAPMIPTALCNVPVNEMGVVFLFGMLARELGFSITRIQREYPDCEALRLMDDDRWQRIWIEFEFESRNFLEHQHDPEKCDLIVCWTNNWPECPIEVLELKSVMQEMGLVLPR